MKKKWTALLSVLMILLTLTACGESAEGKESAENNIPLETEVVQAAASENGERNLSLWPTYWDADTVLQEMDVLKDRTSTVCYFAAYFDAEKKPFIPEESLQTFADAKEKFGEGNWKNYLTIVNDLLLPEGGSSLKDTDLLYALLQDPALRQEHIDEILKLTSENGFDGIEIDYEAIRKDMDLWQLFAQFVTELHAEAQKRGIEVRVLFEPNVPVEELTLPQGPEYVLMCYNLYGYGTEPGPKANREFLIQMSQLLEKMPTPRNMALSIGGFDFAADGSVDQLTEAQCVTLLQEYGATASRDEDSHDLVYSYTDQDGMAHEVWYADNETLDYWMSIGKMYGIDRFSIWRLGSNVTLQ